MRIVEFKKPIVLSIDSKKIKVSPKAMYLFSDVIQNSFKKRLIEMVAGSTKGISKPTLDQCMSKIVKVDDNIDNLLKRFNINSIDKFCNPIILRTGGIGDLIALSSLCAYIPENFDINQNNISFVSQEKYRAIFDWFKYPVKFVSYFAPVASWVNTGNVSKNKIYTKNRPIYFEGVIENSNDNWFEVQYNQIGVKKIDSEYGRPQLRKDRPNDKPSNIDSTKKSILVNPRSTAIIRSMRFKDIYDAVVDVIGDMDVNIYVHVRNLSEEDKYFIVEQKKVDDRIKILKADSLESFLLDAFDVDMTVSVDTALLHFREGVGKCGIGLYGPFPKESRTKYYKYTKSIDLTSECEHMPCFVHVKKFNEICDKQSMLMNAGEYSEEFRYTAPCCCSAWNTTIKDQIVKGISDYLLKNI